MTYAAPFQHFKNSVSRFEKGYYFPYTHIGNIATISRLVLALAVDDDLIATAVVVPSLLSPQTSHQSARKSSCSSFPLHPFVAVSAAPPAIGLRSACDRCDVFRPVRSFPHLLCLPPLVAGARASCVCAAIGSRCRRYQRSSVRSLGFFVVGARLVRAQSVRICWPRFSIELDRVWFLFVVFVVFLHCRIPVASSLYTRVCLLAFKYQSNLRPSSVLSSHHRSSFHPTAVPRSGPTRISSVL